MTYYSQYYANIIGAGLVFEAGGVVGATSRKYVSCLFIVAPQKLKSVWILNGQNVGFTAHLMDF